MIREAANEVLNHDAPETPDASATFSCLPSHPHTAGADPDCTVISARSDLIARALSQPSTPFLTTIESSAPDGPPPPPERRDEGPWKSGQLIGGRYELDEAVSAGAWGTVWRATQYGVERTVALKVLKSREAQSMQSAESRFVREAQLASKIRHPSAVRIVDFGYHEQRPYLVMEWLEGITLRDYLATCGTASIELILQIGEAVAGALHSAHLQGVIHRDLKPSNIMLVDTSAGFTPVVVDFGLARTFAEDEPTVTRADIVIGTPAYMCPEAIRGHILSPSADLYSLGVTLIEAVLGRNPFRGSSGAETMTNHLLPRPVDVYELMEADCPRDIADLLLQLISIETSERPASSLDVHDAFSLARQSPAPPATPPPATPQQFQALPLAPPPPEARPPNRPWRRRTLSVLSILLLALLLGARGLIPTGTGAARSPELSEGPLYTSHNAQSPRLDLRKEHPPSVQPNDDLSPSSAKAPTHSTPSSDGADRKHAAIQTPQELSVPAWVPHGPEIAQPVPESDDSTNAEAQRPATTGASTGTASNSETPRRSRRSSGTASTSSSSTVALNRHDGHLVILLAPPGEVWINGTSHGERSSLLLRELPHGRYDIRVSREGITLRKHVNIRDGNRQVVRL